ncbi:hypothetical protein [uncultured Bradyrhizobium sp.]|uniref:hypothetical protein n=1 Tax=uncultured Bradyrhizobium sp. TaxID=199684 RepID=UPI0035CA8BBD
MINAGWIVEAVAVGLIALRKLRYPGPQCSSTGSRDLKHGRRTVLTVIAVIAVFPFMNHESCAQMVTQDKPPIAYFLDRVPESLDSSTLPKTARDVVIARVRIEGRLTYLVGRDQSGTSPPLPSHLFYARLKITDVRTGHAATGATVDVTFGVPGSPARIHYPHTPNQLDRDYEVVMYSAEDGEHHLVGFPVSEEQYMKWDAEVRSYDRSRDVLPRPQ